MAVPVMLLNKLLIRPRQISPTFAALADPTHAASWIVYNGLEGRLALFPSLTIEFLYTMYIGIGSRMFL